MGARGNRPRPRRGVVVLLGARVLALLGALIWVVAAASFGAYRALRPSLWARILAGASIGVPVLLGAAALAVAGLVLRRRRDL
jgi:LPXTG-motif cell wall-anchored protein